MTEQTLPIPLDTSCEAEYADGYVHSETVLEDASAYLDGKNCFYDIYERRPEAEHGPMVRFTVFYQDMRYDIDWTSMPDTARPIRFRDGFCTTDGSGQIIAQGWTGMRFGYQYNEADGKNVQEVIEL